jgi:hypothetical protein
VEYIGKNAAVDAACGSGKTLLEIVAQCKMIWVEDFMDKGPRYREEYDENLDKSKGLMRSEIYRDIEEVDRDLVEL